MPQLHSAVSVLSAESTPAVSQSPPTHASAAGSPSLTLALAFTSLQISSILSQRIEAQHPSVPDAVLTLLQQVMHLALSLLPPNTSSLPEEYAIALLVVSLTSSPTKASRWFAQQLRNMGTVTWALYRLQRVSVIEESEGLLKEDRPMTTAFRDLLLQTLRHLTGFSSEETRHWGSHLLVLARLLDGDCPADLEVSLIQLLGRACAAYDRATPPDRHKTDVLLAVSGLSRCTLVWS